MPPTKTSSARNGLPHVEFLAKEAPWKYLTSQATAKVVGYSQQLDAKEGPLLKTTLTYVIEHREIEVMSLLACAHGPGRNLAHYWRRKIIISISLTYQGLPARYTGATVAHMLWSNQPPSGWM